MLIRTVFNSIESLVVDNFTVFVAIHHAFYTVCTFTALVNITESSVQGMNVKLAMKNQDREQVTQKVTQSDSKV